MERLRIEHVTEYRFHGLVTLNAHRLILRPREGHDVRIESSRLDISPSHQIIWHRDVFDNSIATIRFHLPSDKLRIVSRVVIQHYEADYPYLGPDVDPCSPIIPYAPSEMVDLQPFQIPSFPSDYSSVSEWLGSLGLLSYPLQIAQLQSILNQVIHREFQYEVREEQGVQSPSMTLARRRGSCRDYATLFIEACRVLGLACRFVSGYLHAPATEVGNASTHAWAEVYFPGIGWKGFDPTLGEITYKRHIAVAVARDPEAIPPVSGSFVGPGNFRPSMFVGVQVNWIE